MKKQHLKKKKIHRNFRNKPFLITISVLILCIIIAARFAFVALKQNQITPRFIVDSTYFKVSALTDTLFPPPTLPPVQSTQSLQIPSSTITPTLTPAPAAAYISDNLGVSFHYLPNTGRQSFFVKEMANTIYIYTMFKGDRTKSFSGSDEEFLEGEGIHKTYVQVFEKDPNQSLPEAIKQHILNGNTEGNCIITLRNPYGPYSNIYTPVQTAVVTIPQTDNAKSYSERYELAQKCSKDYAAFNGIRYFLIDPKQPNKFLFFSIGQETQQSGIEKYPWDQTIRVFK